MSQLNNTRLGTISRLRAFWHDEQGATAVEYGLFVAAIAAVIVVIVLALGGKINTAFTSVNSVFP
jgi:pilus assembly protein Flp/PilA